MAEVVLETRGLSMRFGGVTAVDNVNMLLWERELRCLIGPNGAGKSTLFKCLTGQLRPSEGEVLILDRSMTGAQSHAVAGLGVGIKTQVPSVFDGLSVRENIWISAAKDNNRQKSEKVTDTVLERLQIGDIQSQQVGQLAHGQRQWVELGLVIARNPWLILLDEPAAGMTHEEVERTAALLKEINQTATLIVVEHDMQFIRMIAERVTVLSQGAILTEGSMDEVTADPRVRDVYLGKHGAGLVS